MIGQEWFYIQQSGKPVTYEIKSAKVIGETPRKWILRESEENERLENLAREGYFHRYEPGESSADWSIPKNGEARREGRGGRPGRTFTRVFLADHSEAEREIWARKEVAWADRNVYRIAQHLKHATAKDPALLRKVAELIGYKEEET